MKRKFISLLLVLSALCSIVSPQVFAADITESEDELIQLQTSNGETVSVNQDEYDAIVTISEEEAKEIALLFVKDAIQLDDVAWDENTSITNVVPMYDETENDVVTAYSIELNTGYVVVSAFRDTDSLIPEWSDRAEPLYDSLDLTSEEQVIYLGAYEYYADAGESEVVNLSGEDVNRNDLENNFEEQRNPDNVPAEITDDFVGIATYINRDGIPNPIKHANDNYKGPFVCNDYINKWDSSMRYYTTDYGTQHNYKGHCAPTAITNLILAVGTRYPSKLSFKNANNVFVNVANVGSNNGYYSKSGGGTKRTNLPAYIKKSFNYYNVSPYVSACTQIAPKNAYETVKNHLALNRLVYVSLSENSIYCDNQGHGVICFAYTRLRSTSTGWYKTYLKLADGWNNSGRYLDLADTNNAAYIAVGV